MRKEDRMLAVLVVLFVVSLLIIIIDAKIPAMTGFATSGITTSNVTIEKFLSIDLSDNLSRGITFGSVDTLPATDVNATGNNDSGDLNTSMFVNVSLDSNTNIDICISGNTHLTTSGGDIIGLGNETYANSTNISLNEPALANQVPLTTVATESGANIPPGSANYYRFWLDIPAGTPSGDYNNTITFQGIETGTGC